MKTTIAKNQQAALLPLYRKFIRDSKTGKRIGFKGKRISPGTLNNYRVVLKHLTAFEIKRGHAVQLPLCKGNSKLESRRAVKQWRSLYAEYTAYLYKQGCKDNYVGLHIGKLRTFFNWAKNVCYLPLRGYAEVFRKLAEEPPVLTISTERLKILMDENWVNRLDADQQTTRNLLLFGCTVGLRYGDLRSLTKNNLLNFDGNTYLINTSTKTDTEVCIKLPDYCLDIIQSYRMNKKLLPYPSLSAFNKNLKTLGEFAGWTEIVEKKRMSNNKLTTMKTSKGKTHRFCDLMSSHMMRKTAITTLLMAGVPEHAVRRLSGHAGNSREFLRYVRYSQAFLDAHTDNTFARLKNESNRHNIE
jgi:integrase